MGAGVYNVLTVGDNNVTAAAIVCRLINFVAPLPWIVAYCLARWTTVSTATIALMFVAWTWCALFAGSISYEWPFHESMFLLALAALRLRVRLG
jgi:hypothetical protein